MSNIFPVITLYQPWATWIMRGWKTIETRTHDRFKSLEGKTILITGCCGFLGNILINAGQNTDESAIRNPYLTKEQLLHNPDEVINGFILGSAFVCDFKLLTQNYAQKALIECATKRYGLFLSDINRFEKPIPQKGEMGIWYFDLDKNEKVYKKDISNVQNKLF